MAISPPSDIVLDVLKAADPMKTREAHQALMAHAASTAGGAAAAAEAFDRSFGAARLAAGGAPGRGDAQPEDRALLDSYQKFEAMVLQSFVKSMLPSDTEEFFGKGTAGEMWKGMMAEQLGTVIAEAGGIGIAEHLSGLGVTSAAATRPVDVFADGQEDSLARRLVQELQTDTLADWTEEPADHHIHSIVGR